MRSTHRNARRFSIVLLGLTPLFAESALAESWSVGPSYSFVYADPEVFPSGAHAIGASLGWQSSGSLGLELQFTQEHASIRNRSYDVERQDLRIGGTYRLAETRWGAPYLFAGMGASRFDYPDAISVSPHAAVAVGHQLPLLPELELRSELGARYTNQDRFEGRPLETIDGIASVKLRYVHPVTPTPAALLPETSGSAKPARTEVSLKATCAQLSPHSDQFQAYRCERTQDRDADGVHDRIDACPATVPGVRVDGDGCMVGAS